MLSALSPASDDSCFGETLVLLGLKRGAEVLSCTELQCIGMH